MLCSLCSCRTLILKPHITVLVLICRVNWTWSLQQAYRKVNTTATLYLLHSCSSFHTRGLMCSRRCPAQSCRNRAAAAAAALWGVHTGAALQAESIHAAELNMHSWSGTKIVWNKAAQWNLVHHSGLRMNRVFTPQRDAHRVRRCSHFWNCSFLIVSRSRPPEKHPQHQLDRCAVFHILLRCHPQRLKHLSDWMNGCPGAGERSSRPGRSAAPPIAAPLLF